MTPQEKAKDLVEKMRDEIPCHCDDWEQAKQCALIAVNIAIKCCKDYDEVHENYTTQVDYWMGVKQEIEIYDRATDSSQAY
jgi:hypothetical protein